MVGRRSRCSLVPPYDSYKFTASERKATIVNELPWTFLSSLENRRVCVRVLDCDPPAVRYDLRKNQRRSVPGNNVQSLMTAASQNTSTDAISRLRIRRDEGPPRRSFLGRLMRFIFYVGVVLLLLGGFYLL